MLGISVASLIVTALVCVLSFQGVQKLEVDTNIVKQMKPNLPLAIATKFIDERLTGVYSLGFVFRRKDGENMVDSKTLQLLDQFKTYMESEPGIAKVNSITTLIKKINEGIGTTMVIVTHELETIFNVSHRIIMLDKETKGIIAEGDAKELKEHSQNRKVRNFFNRQVEEKNN